MTIQNRRTGSQKFACYADRLLEVRSQHTQAERRADGRNSENVRRFCQRVTPGNPLADM